MARGNYSRRNMNADVTWDTLQRAKIDSTSIDLPLAAIFAQRGNYDNLPKFQRGKIWPNNLRKYLVDSALRGLPIPPLLVNKTLIEGRERYEIIDGQQRLATLLDFRDGVFSTITEAGLRALDPTPIEVLEEGRFYHQLGDILASRYNNYTLKFQVFNNVSDDVLAVIFRRLQNQQTLSPGELLWSYDGTAAEIARRLTVGDPEHPEEHTKHPIWEQMYVGASNRKQTYETCLYTICLECYGIPATMRIPVLLSIVSRLFDAKVPQGLESTLRANFDAILHLFAGTTLVAKSDMIALYSSILKLHRHGYDLVRSQEGCLSPWFGSIKSKEAGVMFWGRPHIVSQLTHAATQRHFWDQYEEGLLKTPGLVKLPEDVQESSDVTSLLAPLVEQI